MDRLSLFIVLFAAFAATLSAQPMSGSYSIGTAGQYTTFQAAANDLSTRGVSGPVTMLIPPGNFVESFTLGHVPGASSTNRVTFRSIIPGMAKLTGASGPTLTFAIGTATQPVEWYVLDGLEFSGGPGYAIQGNTYNFDIEVMNCVFLAGHGQRLWNVNGVNQCQRWKVHHNRFVCVPNDHGLYLSQISFWEFHHNEIDLNGARRGMYWINLNNAQNQVWNNIFHGLLTGGTTDAALHMAASNYTNTVTHNTFLVTTATSNAFYTMGTNNRENRFYGNVVVVLGGGTCLKVYNSASIGIWFSDGNLYHAPGGNMGEYLGQKYATLTAWRAATGKDVASIESNPLFVSAGAPLDLRILPISPARDAAVNTPAYVVDDFDGNPRDARPDMGAFEVPSAGFFRAGLGCPGSGNVVPVIGHSGTVGIGSANFAVTLSSGLGGAPALLLLGASNLSWGGIPLPVALGGGCSLYQSVTLGLALGLSGTGPGSGAATVPLPIPNDPGLGGANLFLQWLVVDPAAGNALGVVTTQGGRLSL